MVAISQIRKDSKQTAKAAKNTIVCNLYSKIKKLKDRSGGAITHGVIKQLITITADATPQFKITKHHIQYMQAKMANEVTQTNVLPPGCDQQNGPEPLPSASSSHKLGVRSKGATAHNNKVLLVVAQNEIAKKKD